MERLGFTCPASGSVEGDSLYVPNPLDAVMHDALQDCLVAAEKTIATSFRIRPELCALLAASAAREIRSLMNMFETIVLAHCKRAGVDIGEGSAKPVERAHD